MSAGDATICLNMIVKNETGVLARCLASVRPFIDYWVIVDTGSSDGTQDLVRDLLEGIPGELHERSWKNFGANRSEALELARGKADYTLLIDADEVFEVADDFEMPELTLDQYSTVHASGSSGITFYRPQFVKSSLPWRYEGVLHEYVTCDEPFSKGQIDTILCRGHFDGARNVDAKAKYENDAKVLEAALEEEPDNARYVFYLAQSYRDAGNLERAIEVYRRRAKMPGFAEEAWYSLYQCGLLLERLGEDSAPAVAAFLEAYQYRPARAEPLYALARHYRLEKKYALAYLFAARAASIPKPEDILFLDESVYDWRCLDELSIAAHYVGQVEQAVTIAERLLQDGRLPEDQRARIGKNLEFSRGARAETTRKTRNLRRAKRAKRDKRRRR